MIRTDLEIQMETDTIQVRWMRHTTVVCSSYDYLQPPDSPAVLALDAVRADYFRMETQAKDLVQEFQQEAEGRRKNI